VGREEGERSAFERSCVEVERAREAPARIGCCAELVQHQLLAVR
jgi:hypothetical protein